MAKSKKLKGVYPPTERLTCKCGEVYYIGDENAYQVELARLREQEARRDHLAEEYDKQVQEAREAARWLNDKLTDHLDVGDAMDAEIEAKQRWPWLEEE